MKHKLAALLFGILLALGSIGSVFADIPPGQRGYEGQPGNQGSPGGQGN